MRGDAAAGWQPLELDAVVAIFRPATFRWWVSGGHALELHLVRSWRRHDDLDVGITRAEVTALPAVLAGWDLAVAAAGRLAPWTGQSLASERHENNVWCRPDPAGPWVLDVTIGEGDRDAWWYRRDPAVRRPWAEAVLRTGSGVPYLAPELQLLLKSGNPRPKDHLDAAMVVPALDEARVRWLAGALPSDHPWHRLAGVRQKAARLADVIGAPGVGHELLARYREPHRRYHTVEHLAEVLDAVDRFVELAADPVAVELAAWYHDAVYDPRAPAGDSERRSADLAEEQLLGAGVEPARVAEVRRLVLLTAGHQVEAGDADGAVLADADLAILGSDAERYARYAADVRAEYAHLPDDAWSSGRAGVLRGFLDRPRLYVTDRVHQALDPPARRNLETELASLDA